MARKLAFGLLVLGSVVGASAGGAAAGPTAGSTGPGLFPQPGGTYPVSGLAVIVETKPVDGTCPVSTGQDGVTSYHQIKGTFVLEGHGTGYSDIEDVTATPVGDGTAVPGTLRLACSVSWNVSDTYDTSIDNDCYYATRDADSLNVWVRLSLRGSLSNSRLFLRSVTSADGLPQSVLVSWNGQPAECITPTIILTGSQ